MIPADCSGIHSGCHYNEIVEWIWKKLTPLRASVTSGGVNRESPAMQRQSSSSSAYFSARAAVALLFCAAACLIITGTLLAFRRSDTPTNISQRTFTFAERVAYQRAIEDVYWRHRIWPKDRHDPKPSLDAVMSQAQLEKKVADYLRKSQTLEDYWQRPLTPEELQAEIDRMVSHTKQPGVLRELFDLLRPERADTVEPRDEHERRPLAEFFVGDLGVADRNLRHLLSPASVESATRPRALSRGRPGSAGASPSVGG